MKFRPCIDIHHGKVKQIVGGSLKDGGCADSVKENFVSSMNAEDYAKMYKKDGLTGGHAILLDARDSEYYEQTKAQAKAALSAYPGGLQVGGGIRDDNAKEWLDAGASHVIVTSYVFKDGQLSWENLKKLAAAAGKEHLVLDLSCRRRDGAYYIVTDRWQKFTETVLTEKTLEELSGYCAEFLVHAVDAEGKVSGIEQEVVRLLGEWNKLPVTYAGGVSSEADLALIETLGKRHVDVTIGSALDLFGGKLSYREIAERYGL